VAPINDINIEDGASKFHQCITVSQAEAVAGIHLQRLMLHRQQHEEYARDGLPTVLWVPLTGHDGI
jgi:hypothetical protein